MRINPKSPTVALLAFLILLSGSVVTGQEPKSLVATANGEGTVKFGKEQFQIYAVVVKLFEDGKAEINLVTDFSAFISGTWTRNDQNEKTIDLRINGGSVNGNLDGGGSLFLTDDRKSIAGLKLQVINRTTKKVVKADFIAK